VQDLKGYALPELTNPQTEREKKGLKDAWSDKRKGGGEGHFDVG
jgi:hypothetical protein